MSNDKNVLLFGGGGVHDYASICPVLETYLNVEPSLSIDYVIEDYDVFLPDRVSVYDLIIVYHTGGTLTPEQASGLSQHVQSGCGFVGAHCAADSFRNSREYIAMLGSELRCHPCLREMIVSLNDSIEGTGQNYQISSHITHPVTRNIEGYSIKDWEPWPIFEYMVHDEQYLLDTDPRVDVIASTIFKGQAQPVAYTKSWGDGRVFYTILGHHMPAIEAPIFKELFVNGCRWAAGLIHDEQEA